MLVMLRGAGADRRQEWDSVRTPFRWGKEPRRSGVDLTPRQVLLLSLFVY
jgi:hypothetical protein